MEHVVFFPAPDGSPAFRRVASLEDAARLVEHLRNVEGVAEVSVHPLGAEVPLAFRAWYRVELPQQVVPEPAPAPAPAAEAVVPLQPVAPVAEPQVHQVAEATPDVEPVGPAVPAVEEHEVPAVASSNGSGEAPRSLGFFAT